MKQESGSSEQVQSKQIMIPLKNKCGLYNFSGSRRQICKTVCIEIYRFDIFYRGKSNQRNYKTQRQRNRQVNAVKRKMFLVLKKQQKRDVKSAGSNRSFPNINEVSFHYSCSLMSLISSSNSAGDKPFSFTKKATALLYELSK